MVAFDAASALAVPVGHAAPPWIGLTDAPPVPTVPCELSGMTGTLSCRDRDFGLDGREAWIFISIKNRAFTRAYIDWFVDLCEERGLAGRVCPVDDPYRHNRAAEMGVDALPEAEALKIERLSGDIARMAQKSLNGKLAKTVRLVRWRDVAAAVPSALGGELRRAFEGGTAVRRALWEHVGSVKMIEGERQFERYAEFFLAEVPVLLHAYYAGAGALDIYPGEQPPFLWQIEQGAFERELPLLTALTRRTRPLLYLETTGPSAAG